MQKCREINDFTALFGGLEGDRTLDLRVANAALSHLSYKPKSRYFVVLGACLADVLLSHLSYKPKSRYFVVLGACLADVLLSQLSYRPIWRYFVVFGARADVLLSQTELWTPMAVFSCFRGLLKVGTNRTVSL